MQDLVCFLIDDDADDREIFEMALKTADVPYSYTSAKNGMDAIDKLNADESFIPDFIFLDLNMPAMHGTQCLQEIRKIDRLADVPVIIYSTSSNPVYEREVRLLTARHYLVKPKSIKTLSGILSQLLRGEKLPFLLNLD